ncbi:MAG: ABC transporter substrate-binding protein [Planctomycetes bacterium]|nr:ABC transporter substrate-binding protein [Planctomycetota bacterium]
MTHVDPDTTLFDLTEANPAALDVLLAHGFDQLRQDGLRRTLGRQVTLRMACSTRSLDLDGLIAELEGAAVDVPDEVEETRPIRVTGLLPCPVRLPLIEAFEPFVERHRQATGVNVAYELQAASMGTGWIEERFGADTPEGELPDLFLSAGFETFFARDGIGRHRAAYHDGIGERATNSAFQGLRLQDPSGRYGVIAVVPAVFLVNRRELGDAPSPRTWEDLFHERFQGRVALPVGDFDLFSSLLLTIGQRYGEDGLERLGHSFAASMHPAEMIQRGAKPQAPIVTIMPYFFTRMAKPGGPMEAVWPADGAIISPIFLLARQAVAESVQPLADFFASREVGEILAHQGLFPSTHPEVDNRLPEGSTFAWLGWDVIESMDVPATIAAYREVFEKGRPSCA